MPRDRTHLQSGFTLPELLASACILLLLTLLAVPALQGLHERQRAHTLSDQLLQAATLARTHAIQNNQTIVLCPSNDGNHCAPGTTSAMQWLVAAQAQNHAQSPLFLVHDLAERYYIRASGQRTHIAFRPDGSAAGTNATLLICPVHTRVGDVSSVIVANTGRIRQKHLGAWKNNDVCR